MKKTFAIALTILCSAAANALPLVWRADWPAAKPVETLVHRGTDIELQPQWYINGELVNSTNWTFTTFVQTNAQATGEWFGPLPGAAFSHTNDIGAAFYNVMVRAQMPGGGVNYTAFARLRMLDSPGYAPGSLPLPVASIDFSQVVAINAPWLLPDATNGFIKVEIDPTVPAWAKEATPPLPPDYANISNKASTALQVEVDPTVPAWAKEATPPLPPGYAAVSNLAYGAATKADATLTERDFGAWTLAPSELEFNDEPWNPNPPFWTDDEEHELDGPGWYMAQPMSLPAKGSTTDPDATSVSFYIFDSVATVVATRSRPSGYVLGSDTNHILAAQAQMDELGSSVVAVATAATNYTDAATNALAATIPTTAADVGAYPASNGETLAGQVAAIGNVLNGEDARFVSTNYDSVVRLPEAYVELKISNEWITAWQEMRRWNAFTGLDFNWTGWDGFNAWKTNIESELNFKADRAWGAYDSETGGWSPEGFTQVSSSNILIAAGMAYQRTVTSGGSVWILQCNQGSARLGGDTNGFFRVFDGDGNVQFEIVKGDKREVGADASGISVGSGSPPIVTIPYSVEAAEHPTIQCCDDLATANWKTETDGDCIAHVSWSGTSGAYVATVQRKTAGAALFVKASYMAGGDTYINNVAPTKMDSIILNGTKYYLGTATINGNTVLTLSTTAP